MQVKEAVVRTNEMKKMIRDAVAGEERTSRLANTIRELARQNGAHQSPQNVENRVDLSP